MEVEKTDEAIVEQYRQTGDMNSFKSLVRRYQNRIYNACYRMLGNKEEAEEVVQDTFLKIHQGIDKFRSEATFAAWAFRIAHNLCVDILRVRHRKRGLKLMPFNTSHAVLEDGDLDMSQVQQLADTGAEPGMRLDLIEESKVLESSLANIPDSQRIVLVLFDIEGFSYQQIADIVGTSVGTVRSRLHYGRIKLKELLEPYYKEQSQPITPR